MISSTARFESSGRLRRGASWSGFSISAAKPAESALRVVSCPAVKTIR